MRFKLITGGITMKKISRITNVLMLGLLLNITTPVLAQTDNGAGTTTVTTSDRDDDDDDDQDWGWIGLLGLLGLLGLRKRDDRHIQVERRSDTNTNR
jgi:MYXO-CTERM domain-containing protein